MGALQDLPSPPQIRPQRSPECSMIPLSVSLASPMPGRDPTGNSGEMPCPHTTPQAAPMGAAPPALPPTLSITPSFLAAASSSDGGGGRKARPCLLCLPSCRSYDKQRCANTCVAARVAWTRPIPGAKVVGVRRGGDDRGGPRSRPGRFHWAPLPVLISFPSGLEAAPGLGAATGPGKADPLPAPQQPPALGGGQTGGRGAGVLLAPAFALLWCLPSLFPPDAPRLGETEAGKGGGCPGGPRRGRRAMPYLGARRRCRLCCARDTGTCFDLRRRGGAGEQDLPWLPPAAAPAPAPPHAPRPPPHDGRRR